MTSIAAPPLHALIVHRDEDVRSLLRLVVTGLSPVTCTLAGTAAEALTLIGDVAPGLLVASMTLGRMRAADFVAALRRRNPRLVAAFVSGRDRSAEAYAAGADRFLLMPLSVQTLGSELRGILEPAR